MGRRKSFKRLLKQSFSLKYLRIILIVWAIIGLFYLIFIEVYFISTKKLIFRNQVLKVLNKILPSADPGVVNSARYLRHYSITYPTSAFPDYPCEMDYLPSGIFFPPNIPENNNREKEG